jgi:hypothetical protein
LKSSVKVVTATPPGRYADCGVRAALKVFSEKESAEAQAFDAVNATVNRSVPADEAVHTEMWVRVSDVPPFVHADGAPLNARADPDDEAANVQLLRVVDPADTADVPAAPGSPVWSCTNVPATGP